ncbi:sugar kinase [Yoonia sp. 2307UL14-13]|uniref:sugar kinase n=1 Tax=Yoonia sp. 2307UL14-13 TaxID=3126506 RepID=UPI0030B56981
MKFVAVGEAMVEMAPAIEPGQYRLGFAGDTLNTAWYLRQLHADWSVDYLTAVGRDAMSDKMVAFLRDAGIGTDHIQRMSDRTVGLYLITLRDGERQFSYWRGEAAARRLAADLLALQEADIVYFSGITLAVQEGDGRDRLLDAMARARSKGAIIAFDSNLRPRLWEGQRQMREWVTKAAAVSDIILPSHDDEATCFGDVNTAATCARYAAQGAQTVVVKNGPGPVHYRHADEEGIVQPAILTDVVDTTAAGDSFNAGFLADFCDGVPVPEAITTASNVARRVIQGRGALVRLAGGNGM